MQDRLERLVKFIYRKYKAGHKIGPVKHPDEEIMACFIEGKLAAREEMRIKQHLTECDSCAEVFSLQAKLDISSGPDAPEEIIAKVKGLVAQGKPGSVLEILLSLKDGLIELLGTNGDVLVGQELVPAPILRSRQIKSFKDEVVILKDIGNIRVEIKVEKPLPGAFSLAVNVKDRQSLGVIKNLRITLLKGEREIESYINDTGKVVFEHVALGKYTIGIADIKEKLAEILLDIKS